MMFAIGDIVECQSEIAGKPKYHLCVLEIQENGVGVFLLLNSKSGFKGDFVLDDAEVPCLPPSPTGQTVVSFSMTVRLTAHKLELYKARKMGTLLPAVARKLEPFAQAVNTLSRDEKKIVLQALAKIV